MQDCSDRSDGTDTSVYRSGSVRFFTQIWENRDRDRSLKDSPNLETITGLAVTGYNWSGQPCITGYDQL